MSNFYSACKHTLQNPPIAIIQIKADALAFDKSVDTTGLINKHTYCFLVACDLL